MYRNKIKRTMNNKLITLAALGIALLVSSCSNDTKMYDVNYGLAHEVLLPTDSLFGNQRIVPLETTSECLLTKNASIIYADEHDILLSSADDVYRFSGNGKFLNKVGDLGNGRSEHGKIASCSYDSRNKTVYICSIDGKLYEYSIDGGYIGSVYLSRNTKGIIRSIGYDSTLGLVGIKYDYSSKGLACSLLRFDNAGNVLHEEELYSDNLRFDVTMESFPIMYSSNGHLSVAFPFYDKIIQFSGNNKSETKLGLGDNQPTRDIVEDAGRKKELYGDCLILDMKESTNALYLICYHSCKYHSMIIDKETGNVVFSKESRNPKMDAALKIANSETGVWPSFISGNDVYCLAPASEVKNLNEGMQSAGNDATDENSNPIIVVLQAKGKK